MDGQQRICEELSNDLVKNSILRNFPIKVSIYDNKLLLTGRVQKFFQKQVAISLAKKYQEKSSLQIISEIVVA
jgi:osmotically-inducible protein OsmY